MKESYKIVRTVYNTDRVKYQPYVRKKFLGLFAYWKGLLYDGQEWYYGEECENEYKAKKAIELHKKGNHITKTIEEKSYE